MKTLVLLLLLQPVLVFAQKDQIHNLAFRSILSPGIIIGEHAAHPFIQWSGGVHINRWFGGLGIGYDKYRFESIPVFADLRMDLEKQALFIYANTGYNFGINYKKEEEIFKTADKLHGGFYMDLGAGFRAKLGLHHRLIFSAGYSRKNITQEKAYQMCTGCEETRYDFKYNLERIVVKAGWELGR